MGSTIRDIRIVLGALLFSIIQYVDDAFQRRVEDSDMASQPLLFNVQSTYLVRQILGLRIRFSELILFKKTFKKMVEISEILKKIYIL